MNAPAAQALRSSAGALAHSRRRGARLGFSRELVLLALCFGIVHACGSMLVASLRHPLGPSWLMLANALASSITLTIPLLFGVALVQRHGVAVSPAWWRYAVAATAAAIVGTALEVWVTRLFDIVCCSAGTTSPAWKQFASGLGFAWFSCTLAASALAWHRTAIGRVEALRGIQLERAQMDRQAHESRLKAMQARVEPQFLFNTLHQVERLHETDPRRAERMLDELIVYLRAALPQMRDSSSTVANEVALAQAYLNIARIRLADGLASEIAVDDDAADLRFPPMVLLPLIDAAIGSTIDDSPASRHLRITAERDEAKLRITLRCDRERARDDAHCNDLLGTLRERLRALYGEVASVRVGSLATGEMQISVEVPVEHA